MLPSVADPALWQALLEATPLALCAEDRAGRVIAWNPAAAKLYGWAATEAIGQALPIVPLSAVSELEMLRDRARLGAHVSGHDTTRVRKDGSMVAVTLFSAPLLDAIGAVSGRVELATERETRRAADELARQQSVQRDAGALSVLGTLIAGIAHEVRNPLFGMTATLDAFTARFGEREEYTRYFGHLRGEMDRLGRLMKDLLEYGRPDEPSGESSHLSAALTQAAQACAPVFTQAGVRLEAQPETLPKVLMDDARLSRVLAILLENAAQHSKSDSAIRVEAFASPAPAREVTCRILDEGSGIRAEDLPRVFDPFFTRRRGGTGLGLSIARRVVEQHGGLVEVANRRGGGVVVTLRLPAERGEP